MKKELDINLWYKDAIIYELHVRAFRDSNADGIGDFKGLTSKLDYLHDLGINAIWLLPFFPSPLKDDGYDISDYMSINKDYGTISDFKNFIKEAHKRDIKVIAELVINHTSTEHPWFQKARKAKPGSNARNFYVWSDNPKKYSDARIIFTDTETSNWTWDSKAQSYYWHRFFSHQPDLNFENPQVKKAVKKFLDFWFNIGVDGLRLDAVPYLFEEDGTNCENLPQTHQFLKELRTYVDNNHKNKMLLAEANQWPEDAVKYFGNGDECHMAFHFPLMPRLFMAIQMEDSYPIIDIFNSTPDIPDNCQWAMFLRNHDELTLEMVTDEERDYMNRVYAHDKKMRINVGIRRRLAPLLSNNRRKIELMNILLLSFPGTPVIYYGDELCMGDNYYLGDRNGVRTPMQWNTGKNAGFSEANPQKLYLPTIIDPQYHYESINVENQEDNLSSMLWWMKRVIAMRKNYKSFGRGIMKFVECDNPHVLAFIRSYEDEKILVIANLSRFVQVATIETYGIKGTIPEELFSHNTFPQISKNSYSITLTPHGHYWLNLVKPNKLLGSSYFEDEILNVSGSWHNIIQKKSDAGFIQHILPKYLNTCRWFGAKSKKIKQISIIENINIDGAVLCIIEVKFREGISEHYLLPISYASGTEIDHIKEEYPLNVICFINVNNLPGILYDASILSSVHKVLFNLITSTKKIQGINGYIKSERNKNLKNILLNNVIFSSRLFSTEQSNTSIKYSNGFFMKLYRKLDNGINPEVEIIKFLTNKSTFKNIPSFAGSISYNTKDNDPMTIAIMQSFVENNGNAWEQALGIVTTYFEKILSQKLKLPEIQNLDILDISIQDVPIFIKDLIGNLYLEQISLLGKRTAEMHLALYSASQEGFEPEAFSLLYQRSLFQSMQTSCKRMFQLLKRNISNLPVEIHSEINELLNNEKKIMHSIRLINNKKLSAMKIRIHGDYHLGQVLYVGNDYIIMDFEGEPARAINQRKLRYTALKDVAGMLRSFHYSAYASLLLGSTFKSDDIKSLELWIDPWYKFISGIFLESYFKTIGDNNLVPKSLNDKKILIDFMLIEKSIYELGYELNNRPAWTIIPIKGIKNIISNVNTNI